MPEAVGVPVTGLGVKLEFAGKFVACNVTVLPSGSVALTWNVNVSPTAMLRVVPPVTVIVGHWFGGGPSVTVICTVTGVATPAPHPLLSVAVKFTLKVWFPCPAAGVKLNVPVAVGVPVAGLGVKLELAGRFVACNVTVFPSGSVALTWKVSVCPT